MISRWYSTVCMVLVFSAIGAGAAGPVPYSPPDDSRFWTGDIPPVLSWSQKFGSIAYYIEFDDRDDWTSPIGGFEWEETYFDLSEYVTQEEWDPLVFHVFWRVRSKLYTGQYSEPGPTFYFSKTTSAPPRPDIPRHEALLKPWSPPVVFSWTDYPEWKEYYIQFSDTESFDSVLGQLTCYSDQFDLGPYITRNDWKYAAFGLFWRVSAMDQAWNRSPWSDGYRFSKLGYRRVVCYGDSITGGFGSSTFDTGFGGYPPMLQSSLLNRDGRSSVAARWFSGGKAEDGSDYLYDMLLNKYAGTIVVMFGTVDIIDPADCEDSDCRTIQRLGEIVDECDLHEVIPIICTVIPYNPAGGHPSFPDVSVIQTQLDLLNEDIRSWCETDGIAMVDLDQAMREQAPGGDLSLLYSDWAHPNDLGYKIMADSVFETVIIHW